MADPFLGEIIMFGGNFAPRGWAFCNGQLIAINQNTALFSILGTTYGGDGRTTFGLPEMRGRVPMHAGNGPGLSPRSLGQRSGAEAHTLITTEIPSHNHNARLMAENRNANSDTPTGKMLGKSAGSYRSNAGATDVAMDSASVLSDNVGGGQSHNNMQPYLVVNFIIALQGVFPSRN